MVIPKNAQVKNSYFGLGNPKTITATVEVTQEDIDSGGRGNPHTCAIALALRRTFAEDDVCVWGGDIAAEVDGYRTWLPREANEFIVAFDQHHLVSPFKFETKLIKK